ncbi:MAG TPA: disulfide bond formation protein B [Alphaproteobacteria bacterium]|nr:disulfide bond formation protein B [Alphaproteobacteria bacterium]
MHATARQPLLDHLASGRYAPAALVLAASVATLGGAFLFQYVGGLAPCILCIYERYPYGVAIALALIALRLRDGRARGAALLFCALAFAVDAGISAFHVGVEQHWWEGTAACTGSVVSGAAASLEALRQQIMNAPVARCDRIPWSLFGISLVGYNLLITLALAVFSLHAARRAMRRGQ